MVDIPSLFRNQSKESVDVQIEKAFIHNDFEIPSDSKAYPFIIDGEIHRFRNKSKGKNGWYVFYPGEFVCGAFGDWSKSEKITFRQNIGRDYTIIEQKEIQEKIKLSQFKLAEAHKKVAAEVLDVWSSARYVTNDHPYLNRKKVLCHGLKLHTNASLIVPFYNENNVLMTVQYIDANGNKLFHEGGKAKGCYFTIGDLNREDTIYIAEGFATAATIYEQTQCACIVAGNDSNIVNIAPIIRNKFPSKTIAIMADNSKTGSSYKYAQEAGADIGAAVYIPPNIRKGYDFNDFVNDGNDLLTFLNITKEPRWLDPIDDLCKQPAPINWHIKRWLQKNSLMMIHGPSGSCKTFLMIDLCMRIATNTEQWCGHKVKPGCVVYLAGEGHFGIRGRVKAWKQFYGGENKNATNLFLSKNACDLNAPGGYQKAVETLYKLQEDHQKPDLIVIDTLHRFLDGDENSSRDAKTMIDAANNLMAKFQCSVLFVHHTGVATGAEKRARGSSAWRGALDIEINVCRDSEGLVTVEQLKNKDAEIPAKVYLNLHSVPLDGWYDEDEEQMHSAVLVEQSLNNDDQEGIKKNENKKPIDSKTQNQINKFINILIEAFWFTGGEFVEGEGYITRSGLKRFLENDGEMSDDAIKKMLNPKFDNRLIGFLLSQKMIEKYDNGWLIIDKYVNTVLRIEGSNK